MVDENLHKEGSRRAMSNDEIAENVLVVEDDDSTGDVIVLALSNAGYGVRLSKSREEAIVAFDRYLYDFIVMDLAMPGMSGDEFLRRVKHRSPCVVLISAVKNLKAEAQQLGADGWLQKPFDPPKIVEVIRNLRPPCKPKGELKAR